MVLVATAVPSVAGERRHGIAEDGKVATVAATADEEIVNRVAAAVHQRGVPPEESAAVRVRVRGRRAPPRARRGWERTGDCTFLQIAP